MKKFLSLFFAISLTLSACGTVSTQPAPPAQTGTPTITPTATQTPTSTITPLPTIPTFTPTFDVSTIVTVTPAEKAECPKENPDINSSFPTRTEEDYFIDNSNQIQQYLNQGGSLDKAVKILASAPPENFERVWLSDITGDSIDELIFIDFTTDPRLHIFLCQKGRYKDFMPEISHTSNAYSSVLNVITQDLNANNIIDIIVMTSCSRAPLCSSFLILEWNGNSFINLMKPREIFNGFVQLEIKDINNDETAEMIIQDDVRGDYAYFSGFPWRVSTHVYMWDGSQYALQDIQYTEPEFRFQAVQDADKNAILKRLDSAIELYNKAIFDENLLPYSQELSDQMEWFLGNPLSLGIATQPASDPTEYPSLAAYAYYRIMLLHLVQGQEAEAESTYQSLKDAFGTDPFAAPYVEMTTEFWEAYQSTQEMYDGCAAAIQYAVEHPEILTPLGSDYHGWQSHIYVPADVCPFR